MEILTDEERAGVDALYGPGTSARLQAVETGEDVAAFRQHLEHSVEQTLRKIDLASAVGPDDFGSLEGRYNALVAALLETARLIDRRERQKAGIEEWDRRFGHLCEQPEATA